MGTTKGNTKWERVPRVLRLSVLVFFTIQPLWTAGCDVWCIEAGLIFPYPFFDVGSLFSVKAEENIDLEE